MELETVEETMVRLRTLQEYRLEVRPGGNLAYLDDRLVLHPKALLGAGADSNLRAVPDRPEHDAFALAIAGLDSRFQATARDRLALDSELVWQRYLEAGDVRVLGGGAKAVATHVDDLWRLDATAGARRIDEPVVLTAEPVTRDEAELGLALLLAGRVTWARLTLAADEVDWREGNRSFDGDERDARAARVGVEVGREFGPVAAIHLDAAVDRRDYRNSGRYQDSVGGEVGIGGRLATGTRSSASAGLGWTRRQYADDFAHDPSYDDAVVTAPTAQLGWGCEWEKRSFVALGLTRSLLDGIDANATHVSEAQARLRFRLRWESSVEFALRQRWLSDSGAASGRSDHQRTISELSIALEHVVTTGVVVRWLNQATARRSNLDDDFERYVSTLELGVVW